MVSSLVMVCDAVCLSVSGGVRCRQSFCLWRSRCFGLPSCCCARGLWIAIAVLWMMRCVVDDALCSSVLLGWQIV